MSTDDTTWMTVAGNVLGLRGDRPVWQVREPLDPGGGPRGAGSGEPAARMRVRIDLLGSQPAIWREVVMPATVTMDLVHEVVAAAMGWEDYHLHAFVQGSPDDYRAARLLTDSDLAEGEVGVPETAVRLDQVLQRPGDTVGYEYDFGDSWHHVLTLVAVEEAPDPTGPRVRLVNGERACPPEDVGGIDYFNDVVAWLGGDPDVELDDADVLREWLPDSCDPGRLDETAVADRLSTTVASGVLDHVPVSDRVAEALTRVGSARRFLVALLRDARLPRGADPHPLDGLTADDVARAVRPWRALLDEIPPAGLRLTAAGYLPPAVVSRVLAGLELDAKGWWGSGTREDQTWPVYHLREAATALGVVRKARGVLSVTAAGRVGLADPRRLVAHVLSRLPIGRYDAERDAGLLALLALASTDPSDPTSWGARRHEAAELFGAFGWRQGHGRAPVAEPAVRAAMRPTVDVLAWMGGFELGAYGEVGQPTGLGVLLGRAAVLEPAPRGKSASRRR